MGETQTHTDKIRKHWEKHEEYYKTNQPILIVLGVMIIGFFIAKMWTIKHGIPMFIITLIIIATLLKKPKKNK